MSNLSSNAILTQLKQTLSAEIPAGASLWVGYSGGMDSTVLLHALKQFPQYANVKAIHVNHQMSPNANHWAEKCGESAKQLGVPFFLEHVEVRPAGKGVEQAAREARYRAYSNRLNKGDYLLLGHHRDDHVETFFYRLLRGAGLAGLLGIHTKRDFKGATIFRPLLNITRAQIEAYATEHRLSWVDDESNKDEMYDRNYLRHTVLPSIQTRWPEYASKVSHAMAWLRESNQLLEEYGLSDLARLKLQKERIGQSIVMAPFKHLNSPRQKHLVRLWAKHQGYSMPHSAQLAQLERVLHAKEDATPCLAWGDSEIRRYQGRLYLLPRSIHECDVDSTGQSITLNRIEVHLANKACLSVPNRWLGQEVMIRYRQSSIRCKPIGRGHSQTIKKLMQEYKVEPWLRALAPIVEHQGAILAVGDYFICDHPLNEGVTVDQLNWVLSH